MANPFDKLRSHKAPRFTVGDPSGGNRDFTNATAPMDVKDLPAVQGRQDINPMPVTLPPEIYPYFPKGCQPFDFRKLCLVEAGTVDEEFFSFRCPQGSRMVVQAYAVFSDAFDASLTEFKPQVDGNRVFPYHGDPTNNFKINLGLAPDLSNSSLINSQLILEPGQVVRWLVTNDNPVDSAMGVRMVGYFDASARRVTPRFGG